MPQTERAEPQSLFTLKLPDALLRSPLARCFERRSRASESKCERDDGRSRAPSSGEWLDIKIG